MTLFLKRARGNINPKPHHQIKIIQEEDWIERDMYKTGVNGTAQVSRVSTHKKIFTTETDDDHDSYGRRRIANRFFSFAGMPVRPNIQSMNNAPRAKNGTMKASTLSPPSNATISPNSTAKLSILNSNSTFITTLLPKSVTPAICNCSK